MNKNDIIKFKDNKLGVVLYPSELIRQYATPDGRWVENYSLNLVMSEDKVLIACRDEDLEYYDRAEESTE